MLTVTFGLHHFLCRLNSHSGIAAISISSNRFGKGFIQWRAAIKRDIVSRMPFRPLHQPQLSKYCGMSQGHTQNIRFMLCRIKVFLNRIINPKVRHKASTSSIIDTRFFPISMSPLTVPMTIEPTRGAPVSANRSVFHARFHRIYNTSGTNKMPSRKSIPTIVMPSTKALVNTS